MVIEFVEKLVAIFEERCVFQERSDGDDIDRWVRLMKNRWLAIFFPKKCNDCTRIKTSLDSRGIEKISSDVSTDRTNNSVKQRAKEVILVVKKKGRTWWNETISRSKSTPGEIRRKNSDQPKNDNNKNFTRDSQHR